MISYVAMLHKGDTPYDNQQSLLSKFSQKMSFTIFYNLNAIDYFPI